MTVRELIHVLELLDKDKGIWVIYDSGYAVFPPIPDPELIGKDDADRYSTDGPDVREGDYQIQAG